MGMYSIISQVVPALSGVTAGVLLSANGLVFSIALAGLALAVATALAAVWMVQLRRYSGATISNPVAASR